MQCPRALAAHRILDERCYCGPLKYEQRLLGTSGRAMPIWCSPGFVMRLIFSAIALIYRPMIRGPSAEGRLCQSIELDLNGAGKSRSSPESADHLAEAKAFA